MSKGQGPVTWYTGEGEFSGGEGEAKSSKGGKEVGGQGWEGEGVVGRAGGWEGRRKGKWVIGGA